MANKFATTMVNLLTGKYKKKPEEFTGYTVLASCKALAVGKKKELEERGHKLKGLIAKAEDELKKLKDEQTLINSFLTE